MFERCEIGVLDSNGRMIYAGDIVRGLYKISVPVTDGYGRDAPSGGTYTNREYLEGPVVFSNGRDGLRAEFVVKVPWAGDYHREFHFYEFEHFVVIEV